MALPHSFQSCAATCCRWMAAALLWSSSAMAQPPTLHLFANADGGILESEVNGKLTGLSVELLTTALNRSAIAFDITLVPWKRALETARNEDGACAFTAVRTEEREKSFKWIGPLQHNALAVYSLESNPTVIRSIEDLRNYKVGGMVGEAITEMLLGKGIAVDALTGEDVNGRNLTRLKLGRIDFWVRSSIHAAYYAAKQPDIKIKPAFIIQKLGNYLACNLNVPDPLVSKVNATLAQMLKDGTTRSIFSAYDLSP